jgi:hypothetical protein
VLTRQARRAKRPAQRAFAGSRSPVIEPDQRAFARVSAELGLNLRESPNTQARVLATLPNDSLIYLRDVGPLPSAAFRSVCTADGLAGFVWGEYLRET